jgi:transcriptional regulator with XRE-family HTH domain
MPPLTAQLRRAVDQASISRYEICRRTGIDKAVLSRFMSGSGFMGAQSFDALGGVLRLRISVDRAKRLKAKP